MPRVPQPASRIRSGKRRGWKKAGARSDDTCFQAPGGVPRWQDSSAQYPARVVAAQGVGGLPSEGEVQGVGLLIAADPPDLFPKEGRRELYQPLQPPRAG